jgi:hypothetical protein
MRAVDWRIVPVLALVVVATATSYGYHRLLLAQRDLIEHTYEVISTLGVVVTPLLRTSPLVRMCDSPPTLRWLSGTAS